CKSDYERSSPSQTRRRTGPLMPDGAVFLVESWLRRTKNVDNVVANTCALVSLFRLVGNIYQCMLCERVFSNESMKPSRMKLHFMRRHPDKS
ncbi:hypothetical protein M514_18053, partial [Trichuris suis]